MYKFNKIIIKIKKYKKKINNKVFRILQKIKKVKNKQNKK